MISPSRPFSAAARNVRPWMPSARGSGTKWNPSSLPTFSDPKRHRTGIIERQRELLFIAQVPHQQSGATVDEALRQTLMQRIRQAILDRARDALPMRGVARPALFVRGIGPGADLRDAARQRVDVAVDDVEPGDLAREPVFRQHTVFADQVAEDLADQARMLVRRQLAEVGQLTCLPQEA